MYLLEDHKAPDHATLAQFRSLHFALCPKLILAKISRQRAPLKIFYILQALSHFFVTSNPSSTCLYTYKKHLFSTRRLWYIIGMGKPQGQGGYPPPRRGKPSRPKRKGGDSDDYIPRFFLVLYIRCRPDKSDLPDFEGQKKIATNYCEQLTAVCK